METLFRLRIAKKYHALFMEGGVNGQSGLVAVRPVVTVQSHAIEHAAIPLHDMEGTIVLVILAKLNIVVSMPVFYTENGQNGQFGQAVVNPVILDTRQGHGSARIQAMKLLKEKTLFPAEETRLKLGPACKDFVPIKAYQMNGQTGLNVQSVVDWESNIDSGIVVEMEAWVMKVAKVQSCR